MPPQQRRVVSSENAMEPVFRNAQLSDLARIVILMREYYSSDHLSFDEERATRAVTVLLQDPSLGRMWLIEVAGSSIGYLALTLGYSLEFHGRDAFLDELFIQSPYRGHGFGRRALCFVEDICRSLGITALHLEVGRDNVAAQAVYRRAGFVARDRYLLMKSLH